MYTQDDAEAGPRPDVAPVVRALSRIAEYSPPVYEEVRSAIHLISMTPPSSPKSFSGRLVYLGGVFLNSFVEDGRRIEEAILHEYVHQRLWLWWARDHPIPPELRRQPMVSPISGNRRSVETMLQAYYVYGQVATYYRWRLASEASGDLWTTDRLTRITNGLGLLERELLDLTVLAPELTLAEIDSAMRTRTEISVASQTTEERR